MSTYFNAFEVSPVPVPGPDAVAPELFRGIYGMPSFSTVPSTDLTASVDFWTRGLGFFELFSVPGQLVHLRRWAFQDVLLVPSAERPAQSPAMSVTFACVLNQIDDLIESARAVGTGIVADARDTPWNTRDVEIITPENARVIFTAAKPLDPDSREAQNLTDMGIAVRE